MVPFPSSADVCFLITAQAKTKGEEDMTDFLDILYQPEERDATIKWVKYIEYYMVEITLSIFCSSMVAVTWDMSASLTWHSIVAVHGLNPLNTKQHALGTWRVANGKVWLQDFLPLHASDARVFLFGYNSNVALNTSSAGLEDTADQLLRSLRDARRVCFR